MRLSATMIVRDEERVLARCLSSIRDLVDEIVVVDTGSTDDSVAIARSFGAVVVEDPWRDDFAAHRNHALSLATGDWILYIDADEHLVDGDRALLEAAWRAHPDSLCLLLLLRGHSGFTPYREHRLWRNGLGIRFEGAIHEEVCSDIEALVDAGVGTRDTVDLVLDHDGYEGDQMAKHRRNLPLLRKEVERIPDRVFLWFHMGLILRDLGDRAGAVDAWRRGAAAARRQGPGGSVALCHQLLIEDAALHGDPFADLLAEAEELFEDNVLVDMSGLAAMGAVSDFAGLEMYATRLVEADRPRIAALGITVHEYVITQWAHAARARARLALGDPVGARDDLLRALESGPENLEYRVLLHATERLLDQDRPTRAASAAIA